MFTADKRNDDMDGIKTIQMKDWEEVEEPEQVNGALFHGTWIRLLLALARSFYWALNT